LNRKERKEGKEREEVFLIMVRIEID